MAITQLEAEKRALERLLCLVRNDALGKRPEHTSPIGNRLQHIVARCDLALAGDLEGALGPDGALPERPPRRTPDGLR